MNRLFRSAVAHAAAMAFRLVPRRARFAAVLLAGRVLAPMVGRALIRRYPEIWGSPLDETLRILFVGLMRRRVAYDPAIEAHVPEDVLTSLANGGALFVSVHFPLNPFFTRWMHDHGHDITLIRRTPLRTWVWGTDVEVELIRPAQNVMLQIRSKLEEGRPVFLALDRALPGSRPYPVETRLGTTQIATPIFTLAKRMNVPLFFFAVRATKGLPVMTIERIAPEPDVFAERFRRHTDALLR